MKKSIYLFVFTLFTHQLYAQTNEQLESMAKLTCECVNGKNLDLKNRKEVEMQLGLCLLEAAGKNNINFESGTEEIEPLAEKVGLKMATKCPAIFVSFANTNEDTQEQPTSFEVSGKVKSVELTELGTLVLKEDSGKEHRLLWISYFNGSDDFVSDPKKLINKSVTVSYEMTDIYFPKTKSYITSKLIIGLKVN